jgi:lipopolysaccharide export system protein LptA
MCALLTPHFSSAWPGRGPDSYNQKARLLSKIHAFMKHPYLHSLLFVLCTALVGVANAEKADRDKPMNVESDALRYDDLTQTSVFTGRVVLTKGTIIIRGAQLTVREDPEGYQYGVAIAEPGKLAFFRQKREALDEFIEGEGETIEYDGKADTVKFIKTAQLRRYMGAKLNDEFTGTVIFYNNTTDVFTVDNAAALQGRPGAPAGRVRAMLTPKPDAAASAAKPAAPSPSPVLRSSPSLGEEKK